MNTDEYYMDCKYELSPFYQKGENQYKIYHKN